MNLLEYWKEALTALGIILTFIAGRKSRDIKEKTEGAGAIAALQNIYDTYIEHNKVVTEELLDRVKALEKHNRDLQKNFNDMSFSYAVVMGENKKFEAQYKDLHREHELLKTAHEKLQKEFEDYKIKTQKQK